MYIQATVQGLDKLVADLNRVTGKEKGRICNKAVVAAARIVLKKAKANAKRIKGAGRYRQAGRQPLSRLIAANLVSRAFKRRRRGQYARSVRVKSRSEGAPQELWHDQWFLPGVVEYGYVSGLTQWPGKPWFRPAVDATFHEVERKGCTMIVNDLAAILEGRRSGG